MPSTNSVASFLKQFLKKNLVTFLTALWLCHILKKAALSTSICWYGYRGLRSRAIEAEKKRAICKISYHYGIGDIYYRNGNLKKAFEAWKQSLKCQQLASQKLYASNESRNVTYLRSIWTINIGHIALLDYIIKLSLLGLLPKSQLRLYCFPDATANEYYLKKFSPFIQIESGSEESANQTELAITDQKLNMIATRRGPQFLYHACLLAEKGWMEAGHPPLLKLTPQEVQQGFETLEPCGLRPDKWFVTLHVRGHRYRNDDADNTRNTQLEHYNLAIQKIVEAGGQVVILGERGIPIPETIRPYIVDYANSSVSTPELDIFLCGACRFFLGTSSGISHVPGTFGVPTVFANLAPPYSRPWKAGDIWVPKLIWSQKLRRFLTLREMMQQPFNVLEFGENQKRNGIKAQDNAPEDIADAISDMLEGPNHPQRNDQALQDYVNSLDSSNPPLPYLSRLSPRYAWRCRDVLELPMCLFRDEVAPGELS